MSSYNLAGLKYFMYITSKCTENLQSSQSSQSLQTLPYLPIEIRKIIWDHYHTILNINCYVCDTLLINLRILAEPYSGENYSIINGIARCYKCYID